MIQTGEEVKGRVIYSERKERGDHKGVLVTVVKLERAGEFTGCIVMQGRGWYAGEVVVESNVVSVEYLAEAEAQRRGIAEFDRIMKVVLEAEKSEVKG